MKLEPLTALRTNARRLVEQTHHAVENMTETGAHRSDFLPSAFGKETERTLPAARAVVWLSVAFVISAILWGSLSSVDRVVTAEGKVRPTGHVQIINHPRGGKIAEILVKNGDYVAKGQALLRFDPVVTEEELNKLRPQALTLQAELARLEAERDHRPKPVFPASVLEAEELTENQTSLFKERIGSYEEQRRALAGAVEGRKNAVKQHKARLTHARSGLRLVEKQERAVTTLAEKGYYSKLRAFQVQRDVTAVQSDVAQTEALIASTEATLASDEAKLAQFERDWQATILSEIASKRTDLEKAKAAIEQLENQLANLALVAPVAGTVEQLETNTVGQSVSSGVEIMRLTPDNTTFVVDVAVANRDIGFIREGQHATVKFAAYDYQRYGMMSGTVLVIASESSTEVPGHNSTYTVVVELTQPHLPDDPLLRLRSGMLAEVDFLVGNRSPLSYIIDAIRRVPTEALREY